MVAILLSYHGASWVKKSLSGLNTKTAIIIRDSLLEGSFALDSGAGIYSWGANVQLHDSRVENCQAKIGGGGMELVFI